MSNELREHVDKMLRERGLYGVEGLMEQIGDTGLHGAQAVIRTYDVEGHDAPNVLAYRLKHSDLASYRSPANRTAAEDPDEGAAARITPRLICSIRAGCSTPDGINREEARGMYDTVARSRGVPADKLIDMAMGEAWYETKPHPGKDPENPNKRRDYERWVQG